MELYIFNQDDKLLTILSEETGLTSAPLRDELNQVASEPFMFTIEADVDRAKFVKEENRVIFRDKEGGYREFVIKELDEANDDEGPQTIAICLPAWLDELSENFVLDKRYSGKEAQQALNDALNGTRYIGEVEVSLGLASTNFYRLSSVDCIWKILEVWGGEFKDVIEIDGNKITTRKIIIKQRLGADNGARFETDHNIEEIQRTVLSYPKTAMFGWGASLETEGGGNTRYIDFGDVEWKVSNGDPVDKPKGQKWVGDPDALLKYGRKHDGQLLHRFAEFSNQDYEDPKDLLMATWLNLQDNTEPVINYKLSVDLLNKKASLGDGAVAIDREFARPIEIQTRIIAIEYDLLDIEGTTVVEMGQFLDIGKDIDRELDDIREKLEKPRPTPPIDNNSYPDVKPGIPVNVNAVGMFRAIMLDWDYDNAVYVSHYEVYGSQIKDFVPDTQHLLYRGRVSAFGHDVGSNETWYYRIRAVNTRGTASDYSAQVSGTSTRIDFIDMADEIQQEIDDARDRANDAYTNANNATQNALDAIAQSQTAFDEAQRAIGKSDLAINQSVDAFNKSTEAFDKAQDSFDKAQTNATEISGLALRMTNAEGDYASISGVVGGLQTQVGNIKGDVTAVTQLATGLQTRVSNAEGDITSLTQTATGLQTQVNDNKGNITSVTQLAQGLQTRVGDAEGNISALTQTATSLGTRIGEIEDWEIGGRNYIVNGNLNSHGSYNSKWEVLSDREIKSVMNTDHNFTLSVVDHPVENGVYTLSGYMTIDGEPLTNSMKVTNDSTNVFNTYAKPSVRIFIDDETGYFEETFEVDRSDSLSWVIHSYMRLNITKGSVINLKDLKFEKGNKATDWSPAPEDTDQKFSAINQTIDSISTRVQTNADNYSAMTQLVNGIQSTVATKADISTVTQLSDVVDTKISSVDANNKFATKSQLTQTSNSLTSTITRVEDIEDWEIGGSNLLRNSDFSTSFQNWLRYNPSSFDGSIEIVDEGVRIRANRAGSLGGIYQTSAIEGMLTESIWTKGKGRIRIGREGSGRTTYIDVDSQGFERHVFTFDGGATGAFSIYLYPESAGDEVIIQRVKLEKGNKATDWSPAPEDMATQSQISQLSDAINLRVQKNDVIHQINIDTSGVLIQGKQLMLDGDVTVTGGFRVNNANIASVDAAKMTTGTLDAAKVNIINLNATNINSGTLNTDNITVRGGSNVDYTLIDGSFFESRGRFTRTWRGTTKTHDIKLRFENGYLRARNDHDNRSLYFTELGVSTFADGSGDGSGSRSSGTIEFFSRRFNPTYNGLTLYSSAVVGVDADKFKVDSEQDIEFETQSAFRIRPQINSPGNNTFRFTLSPDTVAANVDGYLLYGSESDNQASGFRFSKRKSDPRIQVVGDQFQTGGNTTIEAGIGEFNEIKRRVNNGNISIAHANLLTVGDDSQGGRLASIATYNRQYSASANMHITNQGTLGRITSARKYKTDIEPITAEVANRFFDNAVPVYYRPFNTADDNTSHSHYGYIADDVALIEPRLVQFGLDGEPEGFNYDRVGALLHVSTKYKFDKVESRLDQKDLQIQFLQQKIKQLEEKIA